MPLIGRLLQQVFKQQKSGSTTSDLNSTTTTTSATTSTKSSSSSKMGSGGSHLSPEDIAKLKRDTRFTEEELRAWYKGFLKDCPAGLVTPEEFDKIYKSFFPFGDASKFSSHVFTLFDLNGDGKIDFREFAMAVNLLLCPDPEERLRFVFRIYDVDDSGSITKQEMHEIFKSLSRMLSVTSQTYRDDRELRQSVETMFRKMDLNGDDNITLEEFVSVARDDPNIFKILDATICPL